MKKNAKSIFDKKNLRVLSKKATKNLKGGNNASAQQQVTTDIVIEDILQI